MTTSVVHVPFAADLLRRLAAELSAPAAGRPAGDLDGALVLLPSSRACRTLQHLLLESCAVEALLLPRILTLDQWTTERAARLGLDAGGLPDDRWRALILAPPLAAEPWLQGRAESAPGLASEFVSFFDEARLARRDALLLEAADLEPVLSRVDPAEAEVVAADLERARRVWRLYRRVLPRDRVDHLVAVADTLSAAPAAAAATVERVLVAGFGRLDAVRADLLRAALAEGRRSELFLTAAETTLSRFFAATWGGGQAATGPLAPGRRIAGLLAAPEAADPAPEAAEPSLRERLAAVGPVPDLDPATGRLPLHCCGDPEAESRVVTELVVRALSGPGPVPRIAVATADPRLAARITARLLDAGLDCDSTHGQPLAALPAGLLLRFLLRSALTDLRAEPLLEVLTHPFVRLTVSVGSHAQWTLRLEGMFRRDQGPPGGLAGLHRRAQDRDAAALDLFRRAGPGMADFVTALADAFAPLLPLRDGRPHPWPRLLTAVTAVWDALAAERPLDEGSDRPDVKAAARLFAQLRRDAAHLPAATLEEFAAQLGRLLNAEQVAAHRPRELPLLVTGLVEMRLERCDLLILAGLREGVFPARSRRPLLLGAGLRTRLGLPGWQDALGRDAELFLRLLHGAPRVHLTWSGEEEGQDTLPSPFVARLGLALPAAAPADREDATPVRRAAVDLKELAAAQAAFAAEPAAPPAHAPVRPLRELSWTALRVWRDCPARFLLERGYVLRKEEEIRAEFGRLEYGSLVHAALYDFLQPGGAGWQAVADGDLPAARSALEEAAADRFLPGSAELPQRRLWLADFRRLIGPFVQAEAVRFATWRPVDLEVPFRLELSRLAAWIGSEAAALGDADGSPPLPDQARDLVLIGTIDRIDRAVDGAQLAVVDYKTGKPPSGRRVKALEELQVPLYAAAVAAGAWPAAVPADTVTEGLYCPVSADRREPMTPQLACGDEPGRRLLLDCARELVRLAAAAADPQAAYPLLPRALAGVGPAQLPCARCDFRGVCRLEERPLPPGLERRLDQLVGRKEGGPS